MGDRSTRGGGHATLGSPSGQCMVFPVCLPGGPMTMTYGSWRLQPRYAAVLAHGWPCGRARTALRLSGEINDERDDTGRVRPLFALVVPGARVGEVCEALTEGPHPGQAHRPLV